MSTNSKSIVEKMSARFGLEPDNLLASLKATAFKQTNNNPITKEQMIALLVVADQFNLNPFTKEIYAMPDKRGGIIPVVGVDGWNRIANEHPQFDGVEFNYSDEMNVPAGAKLKCHEWVEAVLHRKDRKQPTKVREYLDECYRPPINGKPGPWQTHTKRFLRHKALIQAYRVGFAFVGIYDEDEAKRIVEAQDDYNGVALPESTGDQAPKSEIDFALFNKQEVDNLLARLKARAKESDQWQAAIEFAESRLEGDAARYAVVELEKSREEHQNANAA